MNPRNIVLDKLTDESSESNAIGNYSVTPREFSYVVAEGVERITNFNAAIKGQFAVSSEKYPCLNSELTNGVLFKLVYDNDEEKILSLIKSLFNYYQVGSNTVSEDQKSIVLNSRLNSTSMFIDLNPGDRITLVLNDDFSDLTLHEFSIVGYKTDGQEYWG